MAVPPLSRFGVTASAALLQLSIGVSCNSRPAQAPETEADSIERYYPLVNGTLLQYDTLSANGKTGMRVVKVQREDGHARLSYGNVVQELEFLPEEVQDESGFTLLKEPLRVGNAWQGPRGRIRVVAKEPSVLVPAGEFTDCIETELQTQATVEVHTERVSYCAGVGAVRYDLEIRIGSVIQHETASLRYAGPPVSINP